MSDDDPKPNNLGCVALFVPTIVVLDCFGVAMSSSGPYTPVVFLLGLIGFGGGAALGGYCSAKTRPPTRWSPDYWLIFALIGISIPSFITIAIFRH